MTLIVNEIHILKGLRDSVVYCAADRLVTVNGKRDSLRKKIFKIPHRDATVSYFGLAGFHPRSGMPMSYLSDRIPNILLEQGDMGDLRDIAISLRKRLNNDIPGSVLSRTPSGFHICGYNNDDLPELWYFSNILGPDGKGGYEGFLPKYEHPSEDFLARDAVNKLGYDGKEPTTAKNGVQVYRNGDVRVHGIVWSVSTAIFAELDKFSDFKRPDVTNCGEYERYLKFQLGLLSDIYTEWCKRKIIGKPIDCFSFRRSNPAK